MLSICSDRNLQLYVLLLFIVCYPLKHDCALFYSPSNNSFIHSLLQLDYGAYRHTLRLLASRVIIIQFGVSNSGNQLVTQFNTLFAFSIHLCVCFLQSDTISYSPLGYYFASCSFDRTARIWNTEQIQPLRILAGHSSDVDVSKH